MRQIVFIWPIVAITMLFTGCSADQRPVYQGKQGFRITPPPGWVERVRDDVLPAKVGRKEPDLPLPPLGASSGPDEEKLLVRYDRVTAGRLAWLRVTTMELPEAAPLSDQAALRTPGANWKREFEPETLKISDLAGVRIAFLGRWNDQEYVNETVTVRHGGQVYFITASFPAQDKTARDQVRQSVAGATWK